MSATLVESYRQVAEREPAGSPRYGGQPTERSTNDPGAVWARARGYPIWGP